MGDHLLAPEWTSYHKRIQYQAYDVTSLVKTGQNAVGGILGNGWYCGLWQNWPPKVHIYGEEPFLLARIEIETADGKTTRIVSDESWKGTTDGPIRFSGIYEGENYDARKEMPGWDKPSFDDNKWQPAKIGHDLDPGKLVWQRDNPIRMTCEIKPIKLTQPKPGVYVYDLGQNIAGWCRIKFKGAPGTTVTLKHNEVLNPDGTVYMDNLHAGHFCKGDRQIVRYTFKGSGAETFEPHFTYQGFRYVEVTGLADKPALDALVGRVFHTDCPEVGRFECSNPLLNRLAQNIIWSQRANFMGVPTDCCQRDERCGYTGDAQFFMPTALYGMDIGAFFSKWLVDVCQDSQRPEGWFADHAPDYGAGPTPNVGWSDAGIICPYMIYRAYGDTRIIRDNYAAMRRNLQMLIETGNGYTRGPDHVGNGDWLNLGGGASNEVIGTAYYAYCFRLMAEMAQVIGEQKDAVDFRDRADKIARAFADSFIDSDGRIKDSSQTGYALAFTMGLAPDSLKQKMADRFAEDVKSRGWHLATGFIGTPRLLPGLHEAGRDDVAYRLLLQENYPSWLYEVKLGATTMWERWDGWRPEKGYQDSGMNSFNHYAFGSVGEYMYGMVGGIRADSPGYAHVLIRPVIGEGITWARTTYDSIRGPISTDWKLDNQRLTLHVTIPPNTSATVRVPAKSAYSITESGLPAAKSPGVKFLRTDPAAAVFEVESGNYEFVSEM